MSDSLTWFDAAGVAVELTNLDGAVFARAGAIGLDAAPVEMTTSAYLSASGAALVGRRFPRRRVAIPFHISGSVRDTVQLLAATFQGPGVLRLTQPDRVRELTNVIYELGLEGAEASGVIGQWSNVVVGLVALDPWWYGESKFVSLNIGAQIDFDDSDVDFDDAATGFDGPSSTGVTVDGHAAVSPVTTIEGPFDSCIIGIAGGQAFELAGPLAAGDAIIVDTRPGSRGPRLNGGAVDWSLLTPASRLWEMPVGVTVLNSTVSGDDIGSNIEVTFRERWLTP